MTARAPLRIASATWRTMAHVPERIDPAEPTVTIEYRYHRGCAASPAGKAEPAGIELLRVERERDGLDMLPRYRIDRELLEAWSEIVEAHARATLAEIDDAAEAKAEEHAERMLERRRERLAERQTPPV